MGMFLNPDNDAFQSAVASEIYVDKTGLIEYTNRVLNTNQRYICNSRPRRFGKSITADMLTAYYSKGCDSKELFAGLQISKSGEYQKHLNKYDVIHFDVQWCYKDCGSAKGTVSYIEKNVIQELKTEFPDFNFSDITSLGGALARIALATGRKFVIIIDEWDVLIRDEAANIAVQNEYLDFLRTLFKGTEPSKFLHLAFLTGILPIKKVKTESALNNFDEFSMVSSKIMAPYIGFTEDEVKQLCEKYRRNFGEVKRWYDGYLLGNYQVYNPRAVVSVMLWGEFQSYWSQTGSYESILPLITMDFDGLKEDIIDMLSGRAVKVKTTTFQNDMVTFRNKYDVLTALIHLGYLAFRQDNKTAFIPNEEIRTEFEEALDETKWSELIDFQRESKALLDATLNKECRTVAEKIEKIHSQFIPSVKYNDENSLSSVLTLAYLSAMQYYFIPIREMPTGCKTSGGRLFCTDRSETETGFADYVFLPKTDYIGELPALLVELKWNKSAETAIQQIKDRNYVQAVANYTGNILLVGINYDKESKEHECVIEEFTL